MYKKDKIKAYMDVIRTYGTMHQQLNATLKERMQKNKERDDLLQDYLNQDDILEDETKIIKYLLFENAKDIDADIIEEYIEQSDTYRATIPNKLITLTAEIEHLRKKSNDLQQLIDTLNDAYIIILQDMQSIKLTEDVTEDLKEILDKIKNERS